MANGLTSDQMTERMYTEMVGIDGQSGLKRDILDLKQTVKDDADDAKESRKKIHEKIELVEATSMTKEACNAIRAQEAEQENKEEQRVQWSWQKRIAVTSARLTATGVVIAGVVFLIDFLRG